MSTPSILVANGVNLDMLGTREPDVYGSKTLQDLEAYVGQHAAAFAQANGFGAVDLQWFQTNDESAFLGKLSETFDGIVVNPAAWTHSSIAVADRLAGLSIPYVEVHLSNIAAREEFRHKSYSAKAAAGVVFGLGFDSYLAALWGLLARLRTQRIPGGG